MRPSHKRGLVVCFFFFLDVIIHILTAFRRGLATCETGLCFLFFFCNFRPLKTSPLSITPCPPCLIDRFRIVRLKTRSFTNFVPTNQIKLTLLGAWHSVNVFFLALNGRREDKKVKPYLDFRAKATYSLHLFEDLGCGRDSRLIECTGNRILENNHYTGLGENLGRDDGIKEPYQRPF